MERMTVDFLQKTLKEMKGIYPFKDDKTVITTTDIIKCSGDRVFISTTDEKTGIDIHMEKKYIGELSYG